MAEEVGRPPELTVQESTQFAPQVLYKLESAFLKGMNNREAIFLADISESLFYKVCEKSPELLQRFKLLQENVKVRAKEVIAEAIDKGDKQQANWYLERKSKDEFSLRTENTGADGAPLQATVQVLMYGKDDLIGKSVPNLCPEIKNETTPGNEPIV